MMFKQQWNFFGRILSFYLRFLPERNKLHLGMGNRCVGGLYCTFLDYDHVPLSWIEEEIVLLQEAGLGNAYIFETKHGYHVVFLQKSTLMQVYAYLGMSSCDKHYREVPMLYARKIWVLRQSQKHDEQITYVGVRRVDEQKVHYLYHEQSKAHALYLLKVMKVPLEDIDFSKGKWDAHQELEIGYYKIREENN